MTIYKYKGTRGSISKEEDDKITECPHCGNKFGFVFGTCIECNYNYISQDFSKVQISVDTLFRILPEEIVEDLIDYHADMTKRGIGPSSGKDRGCA